MRVKTAWFKFGEPIKIHQTAKLKSPPNKPRIWYISKVSKTAINWFRHGTDLCIQSQLATSMYLGLLLTMFLWSHDYITIEMSFHQWTIAYITHRLVSSLMTLLVVLKFFRLRRLIHNLWSFTNITIYTLEMLPYIWVKGRIMPLKQCKQSNNWDKCQLDAISTESDKNNIKSEQKQKILSQTTTANKVGRNKAKKENGGI